MINKRYREIFEQYIYKNEKTPLTVGTLVVCALCFLALLVSIFTQFTFSHPSFSFKDGFDIVTKTVHYVPQIPVMVLIIYILRRNFSLFTFTIYLLVGFFIWPIFVLGGGLGYVENYLFGYMLGFYIAVFIMETILSVGYNLKARLLAAVSCIFAIHITGFIYCLILALFKVIDFTLILPIVSATTKDKIIYDILFTGLLMVIAPYLKNVLWTTMKPKPSKPKLKNMGKADQKISDDIDEHGQYNN